MVNAAKSFSPRSLGFLDLKRDSESLAITYDVMATTRLIVYLNASFAITGNVKDRSFNLAENRNKGQRISNASIRPDTIAFDPNRESLAVGFDGQRDG